MRTAASSINWTTRVERGRVWMRGDAASRNRIGLVPQIDAVGSQKPLRPGSIWTPKVLRAIDTRWYCPTAKTKSMSCSSDHVAVSAVQVSSRTNESSCSSSVARRDCRLVHGPTRGAGPRLDALDLLVVEAALPADDHVLRPLVFRPAEPPHPQDRDLALAGRERGLDEDMAGEDVPALEKLRVADEGLRDVEQTGVARGALDGDLALLLGKGFRVEWRYAGLGQSHRGGVPGVGRNTARRL